MLRNILQGMLICTIMQVGEVTTCTLQSLNVTLPKELLSTHGTIYFNSLPSFVKNATKKIC